MGRSPRIFIPGFPHHVVQRGHNRNAVFVETRDYEYYLANLIQWKNHFEVGVYAYCLMTNHVHLVLVPFARGDGISGLMRRLSARQGRRVNQLERRVGSLWSGRFKSSVVDRDSYLLACLRYVELNPVRAGMVSRPEEYRWSSYRQRVGLTDNNWLDCDPVIRAMGATPALRHQAYARFVQDSASDAETVLIRDAVRRNQLTGGEQFVDEIEHRTGLRIKFRGPGRPSK